MPGLRLRHPLVLFIVGNLVTTCTAAFTSKNSLIRYAAWLLSVTISFLALSNFHIYIQTTGWAGRVLAGALFTIPLVLFDRLLVRQWAFGHDFLGPVELPDVEKKKQSRWKFGSDVSGSTRCIGSEKEVANVPYFSQENPRFAPSQSTFLLRHVCLVVGLYYLSAFCVDVQLRANHAILVDDYVPFLWRITEISLEEIVTRVQISLSYWLAQYCILQLPYSLFAVITVSLKPQELKLWRPMFGSIKACCTVRAFWSKFWHQNLQLNLKGPADFLTHTVLRIPQGTVFARYAKIFFAFSISGVMHVVADFGGAVPAKQSGALRFFCTQALGIMLEDGVQELYKICFGNWHRRFCKVIGYLWFLAFLSWSTPAWVYPVVRSMERDDMILTFDALRPLVSGFW